MNYGEEKKGGAGLSSQDLCGIRVLLDEGIFFQKLIYHHKHFEDEASSMLVLTALPFIAIIEHDAIPFLNRTFSLNVGAEDDRITQARHLTKSLNSKYLDYGKYASQVDAILEGLPEWFGAGRLYYRDVSQPNIGICFYEKMPVFSNYAIAHYFTDNDPSALNQDYSTDLGYQMGVAGSFLYGLADKCIENKSLFHSEKFEAAGREFRYSTLMGTLEQSGVFDRTVFFLFSETLMHLSAVQALCDSGFYNDRLWLKFTVISAYHALKTIDAFLAYAYQAPDENAFPVSFLKDVSSLLEREERKFIVKTRPLRNAFIHYDFGKRNISKDIEGLDPDAAIEAAIVGVMGMELQDFISFLAVVCSKLIFGIVRLIGFPLGESAKDISKIV